METKRNVKYFTAPPISIPTIIGLAIFGIFLIFTIINFHRMFSIIGMIAGLFVLIFASGGKSNDTDIEYQARELTKDLQEYSMKKFDVYEKNFLKMLKPINLTGYDFEPSENDMMFKKGADGTPRTNYFAAYNLIFTGEKIYIYGKRISLTDENVNDIVTASYKYNELSKCEIDVKTYKSEKGDEYTYYVFKIFGEDGDLVLNTCIDYGADSDKAVEDINRAIAVRRVEIEKRAEERAIKLREFREKVMAGTADLPQDEGFI